AGLGRVLDLTGSSGVGLHSPPAAAGDPPSQADHEARGEDPACIRTPPAQAVACGRSGGHGADTLAAVGKISPEERKASRGAAPGRAAAVSLASDASGCERTPTRTTPP